MQLDPSFRRIQVITDPVFFPRTDFKAALFEVLNRFFTAARSTSALVSTSPNRAPEPSVASIAGGVDLSSQRFSRALARIMHQP
jgi:hypothetical protein